MKYSALLILLLLITIPVFPQNGIVKSYDYEGNISTEKSYTDDVLDGVSFWYYPNGNLKIEKTYDRGKLNGWVRYFYPTGLIKEEYFVSDGKIDGNYRSYYENGALKSIKKYQNGILTGEQKLSYDANYKAPEEAYKAGNRQYKRLKAADFMCDVEICPVPIGGMDEIMGNLVYPDHAKSYGLEGTVQIIATIDTSGSVIKTIVIKDLGLGCTEAAIEAVQKTNFFPGKNKGEKVQADVNINVPFRLKERTEYVISEPPKPGELPETLSDSSGETETTEKEQNVLPANFTCDADKCPEPEGGLTAILNKIKYPKRAMEKGIEGYVIINTEVDEFGFVLNTEIEKGLGYGCDDEAEFAVLETRFKPALKGGKEVKTTVKIVVPFVLEPVRNGD